MIKESPRLCIFVPSLRSGGGEKVMLDLANWYARHGVRVDLLTVFSGGELESRVDPQVRLVPLRARRFLTALPAFIRYLRREQPGTVMALDEWTHLIALAGRMLARPQTRVVLRVGNMLASLHARYRGLSRFVIPFLSRLLYPRADAVISISAGVGWGVSAACGVSAQKVHPIHNPKDLDAIRAQAREPVEHLWLAEGYAEPVIATVGRFHPQKDYPTLLKAFALLQKRVAARLIVISGGDSGEVRALAQELGVGERVDFLGQKDNPHAYVAKAQAFVLTSAWEGLPNSLMEAMVCGVPVVCTDCDSGPRELLASESDPAKRIADGVEWGSAGALVPVGGVTETAEALCRLCTEPDLHMRYAQAAKNRSEDFAIDAVAKKYAPILNITP